MLGKISNFLPIPLITALNSQYLLLKALPWQSNTFMWRNVWPLRFTAEIIDAADWSCLLPTVDWFYRWRVNWIKAAYNEVRIRWK